MIRWAAVLVLLLTACSDPTRLVVVLDSAQALDEVVIRARSADGIDWEPEQRINVDRLPLPQSFVVEPLDGDASNLVAIEVQGLSAGSVVAARAAQAPFLSGRCARLDLGLDGMCEGCARCEEFCPTIAKSELIPIRCGSEVLVSKPAPTTDAGSPMPVDGGPAPDQGTPPVPGSVVVSPTSIDFNDALSNPQRPQLRVGQQVQVELRLSNPGDLDVVGLSYALEPPFYVLGEAHDRLEGNKTKSLFVSYRPTLEGTHTGLLELRGADGLSVAVSLIGLATACPAGMVSEPDGSCRMECPEGTRDLDPNDNVPCECQILSEQDSPDADEIDANCDGLDGTASASVFVSPSGSDTAAGTRSAPVATIQHGLALAQASSPPKVLLVSEGTYTSATTLNAGTSIYGGYSQQQDWRRDGLFPRIEGPATALRISGAFGVVISRLELRSQNAAAAGESSIAIDVRDSQQIELRSVVAESRNGASGTDGQAGTPGGSGIDGHAGRAGDGSGQAGRGGNAGAGACGEPGGEGGNGGAADLPGTGGAATMVAGGSGGQPANACAVQTQCTGGRFQGDAGEFGFDGVDASGGSGGTAAGAPALSRAGIVNLSGTDGAAGAGGAGGSGGGGGGGASIRVVGLYCDAVSCWCDYVSETCSNSYSGPASGGGGGGSGGCAGTGGAPGTPGGSSVALAVFQSDVMVTESLLRAGPGGDGGAGGVGGRGGRGGSGGRGGADPGNNSGAGGDGGKGGDGGGGGGGAGASGGWSVAIARDASSIVRLELTESFVSIPGNPGAGGRGGAVGTAARGLRGAEGPTGEARPEAVWDTR